MAKFNIEVELDWIDDENYSIDEEIKEQVVKGVKEQLLKMALDDSTKKLDLAITEKVELASDTIQKKMDSFVANICEEKIASMKIPRKNNSWSDDVKYIPMSEFVGERYEAFLNKRVLDSDGNEAKYRSDAKISINEYFIDKYLNKELASKVSGMIQTAKKDAEETVLKTLEQNLKDQLAVDTIKRLNIPKLLENLQTKALEFEKEDTK